MTDHHLSVAGDGDAEDPWAQATWYFTFGLDHPLAKRFVRLHGTHDGTRELMSRIFGQGNWAEQYSQGRGPEVVTRHKLARLDLGLPAGTRA